MAFDLSTIKFNVETGQLKEAVTAVGDLATAVGKMNEAIKKSTQAKRDDVKASKEQAQEAQNQENTSAAIVKATKAKTEAQKGAQEALKATGQAQKDLGSAAEQTGEKLSAAEKIVAKNALTMSAFRGESLKAVDGAIELGRGFTKSQAAMQAHLVMVGGTIQQLSELAQGQKNLNIITGANKFDQSLDGLTKMQKEYKELTRNQKDNNQETLLTREQQMLLSRDKETLIQKAKSLGLGYRELSGEIRKTKAEYASLAVKVNEARAISQKEEAAARQAANAQIKAAQDTAAAKAFVTKETERLNSALTNTAQGTTVSVSNQLLKMENALKRAGFSASETTAKLETYRQGLLRLQKTNNDRSIDNISRALGPQITDISVGLATGQSPLTILLQQGGQLRDQMALAGVATDQMGAAIRRAGSEMASSVWATSKGVITGIGGAMLDLGKSASKSTAAMVAGFASTAIGVTSSKKEVEAFNASLSDTSKGIGKFMAMMNTGLAGGVFITAILAAIAAVVTLGVQLYNSYTAMKDFSIQNNLTAASMNLSSSEAKFLAENMRGVGVSTGKALEVFTQVAKTGNIPKEVLSEITKAAIELESVGGQAIEETIKTATEIGKNPVEALRKFQIETGLVDQKLLDQVETLYKTGRAHDAVVLASKGHAAAIQELANKTAPDLDFISGGIRGIVTAWNMATKAATDYYRDKRAKEEADKIAYDKDVISKYENGGVFTKLMLKPQYGKAVQAENSREAFDYARKQSALQQERLDLKSKQAKVDQAAENLIRGFTKPKDETLSKNAYIDDYIKKQTLAIAQTTGINQAEVKLNQDRINRLKQAAAIDYDNLHKAENTKAVRKSASEQNKVLTNYQRDLKAVSDLLTKQEGKTEDLTQAEIKYNQIRSAGDYAGYTQKQKDQLDLTAKQSIAQEELNRQTQATIKFNLEYAKVVSDNQDAIEKESIALNLRAEMIGKTVQEQKKLRQEYELQEKLRLATAKYKAEIAKVEAEKYIDPKAEAAVKEQLLDQYNEKLRQINRDTAIEAAENFQEEFKNIHDAVADTIADALYNGGKKGTKSLREAIVAKLREPMTIQINAIANVITQGIGSAVQGGLGSIFGGGGQSSSGAGGLSNLVSSASSFLPGGGISGLVTGGMSLANTLGSAFANFTGGGIDALLMTNGAFGTAAAGSTAGAMSGLMSGLGAAMPWIAGALAIASIIGGMDDSGTLHTGAVSQYSANKGTKSTPTPGTFEGDPFGTGFIGVQYSESAVAMTTGIAKAMVGIFDSTAKKFGKTGNFEVATGFADDSSGDGAWGSLRINQDGKKVVNWNDDRWSRWAPREISNGAQGQLDYYRLLSGSIRDTVKMLVDSTTSTSVTALTEAFTKGTTSSENFQDYLILMTALTQEGGNIAGLNTEIAKFMDGTSKYIQEGEKGSAALLRLLTSFSSINTMLSQLGKTMFDSTLVGLDFTNSLTSLFGGIQNLQSSLATYYTNYFSDSERTAFLTSQLTTSFSDMGLTLPKSVQEMRNLIQAQDLTTQSGREAFTKLIGLSGGITTLYGTLDTATTKMQDFTSSILDYIANLSRTEGTTAMSTEFANREFATQLGLASAGNSWSMEHITAYADQVIARAKETSRNAYEYDKTIASVQAELLGLTNGSKAGTTLSNSNSSSSSTVQPIQTVADNTLTTQQVLQQILAKLTEMQAEDRAEGVPTVTSLSDIAKVIKRVDNGDSLRITDVTPA